jgi:hypothetical protein
MLPGERYFESSVSISLYLFSRYPPAQNLFDFFMSSGLLSEEELIEDYRAVLSSRSSESFI